MNTYDLNEIAAEFGEVISTVSARIIQDKTVAEDAAQEVWYEICRSIDSFRGESSLSTWIFTVTKRVIYKYAMKEKKYSFRNLSEWFDERRNVPLYELTSFDRHQRDEWVRDQCAQCLNAILHCLDNERRLMYVLFERVPLRYDELAEIFEKPAVTIRKIISRSKEKIRKFLDNECVLFNPDGACTCRLHKEVFRLDLPGEVRKMQELVHAASFFTATEKVLPKKNYWKKFLS